ncbi:MAG: hypothetical protein JSW54_08015, partial [Fidelibacterota bacterium]
MRLLVLLALLSPVAAAQTVPADTLLARSDLSLVQKLWIAPIALFQRLSYATPALGCQFEPSCSHF